MGIRLIFLNIINSDIIKIFKKKKEALLLKYFNIQEKTILNNTVLKLTQVGK